jgi:hypothetical protein
MCQIIIVSVIKASFGTGEGLLLKGSINVSVCSTVQFSRKRLARKFLSFKQPYSSLNNWVDQVHFVLLQYVSNNTKRNAGF